LRKTETN
jgi:hypothetical protein